MVEGNKGVYDEVSGRQAGRQAGRLFMYVNLGIKKGIRLQARRRRRMGGHQDEIRQIKERLYLCMARQGRLRRVEIRPRDRQTGKEDPRRQLGT